MVARLSVYGAVLVTLVCGSPSGASDHQAAPASRPDFSGEWVLETASPSSPDVPRTLSVRLSPPDPSGRSRSREPFLPAITIEKNLETGPVIESHPIGIVGGTVGPPLGPLTSHAVKWEGNALVFESESHSERTEPATWTERREVWSLDEAGRLRIVISSHAADAATRTQTMVYRRR